MLDTSDDLRTCETEIGCPVEQLLTPLTRFRAQYPAEHFAIDNGAYAEFRADQFVSLLVRESSRKALCRFVAVPDVVASARRTLEVFDHWYVEPCLKGWPLALVAQDGQENQPIPWQLIDAVFVGGTTEWKLGQHVVAIIKAAKAIGKWVHIGRVNTPGRFEYFEKLGADSIDGTGISRYSWMRERIYKAQQAPNLFSHAQVSE